MRLLVVEDEERLAASLKRGLEADGFALDVASDGTDGLWMAQENAYDAIVLDLMLPGVNGYRICTTLRAERNWTPIVMLTAKDDELDETEALDTGADDFLTKPFSHLLLVARIRALLRRGAPERPVALTAVDLRLDPASRRVWKRARRCDSRAGRWRCSSTCCATPGRWCRSATCSTTCGTSDFDGDPNIVEVYVRYLGASSASTPARPSGARATACSPMPSSVRVRTTIGATVVVGMAFAVGAVLLVALLRRSLTDDVETAAELRATDVVSLLRDGEPPAVLAGEGDDESVVQVLDADGSVVASSENAAGSGPLADVEPGTARTVRGVAGDVDPFRVVARAAPDGSVVLAAQSLDRVDETAAAVTGIVVLGVPVLQLLAAGTTWVVVGRALQPVEAMRREVAAISARELDRRVPVPPGDDEIGRPARTMNAMLERLERAQDRQRRFVSDASHELRSPLTSSRRLLEVSNDHAARVVLLAENERMAGLVDDLLLARLDEAQPASTRGAVDVDDLVLAEAGRLRRRGTVHVDTTAVSGGQVDGDAGQLARVVRNLADNAARHARSSVRFAVPAHAGRVVLTVDDDGPGVPADERDRIFERFTRLDGARSRDAGGAGLGLAIVAEVAAAHGGEARVEDADDGGARFVVDLPSFSAR